MHMGSILSPTLRGGSLAVAVAVVMWATALNAKATSEQEAHAIGVDAYLYFYSLVTMDLTRKQLTNVETGKGFGGPMNTFANAPAYPTAQDRAVVRPNFDTLYSSGWLDLTNEPMVVSIGTMTSVCACVPVVRQPGDANTSVHMSSIGSR